MARPPMKRLDAPALPTTFTTPAGAVAAARATTRRASSVPTQRTRGRRPVEAPAPLGSLVTAPVSAQAHVATCAQCAGTSLTSLAMTLTDGSPVTFVSCHECEARGWFGADGTAMRLDAVLSSAARG